MPDEKCPVCFHCGVSFGAFRRRHHCRLCGQIFCHSCSCHFVAGKLIGRPREQQSRLCEACTLYCDGLTIRADRARLSLPLGSQGRGSAAAAGSRASAVSSSNPSTRLEAAAPAEGPTQVESRRPSGAAGRPRFLSAGAAGEEILSSYISDDRDEEDENTSVANERAAADDSQGSGSDLGDASSGSEAEPEMYVRDLRSSCSGSAGSNSEDGRNRSWYWGDPRPSPSTSRSSLSRARASPRRSSNPRPWRRRTRDRKSVV